MPGERNVRSRITNAKGWACVRNVRFVLAEALHRTHEAHISLRYERAQLACPNIYTPAREPEEPEQRHFLTPRQRKFQCSGL